MRQPLRPVQWVQLVIAIAIAFPGTDDPQRTETQSIAKRYDSLRTAYLDELSRAKSEVKLLKSAFSLHQQALRDLVAGVSHQATDERSWKDELALAEAYEMLSDSENAARHGANALAMRPEHPRSYCSFLRSALNLGRMAEAEKSLSQATATCPASETIAYFHYFMFVKYKALQQSNDAERHCQNFLDFYLDRIEWSPLASAVVARMTDEFYLFWFCEYGREHADDQLERCANVVQLYARRAVATDESDSDFAAIAGHSELLGLQAVLFSLLDRPQLTELQLEWITWLLEQFDSTNEELTAVDQVSLLTSALDRIAGRSCTGREAAPMREIAEQVNRWLEDNKLPEKLRKRLSHSVQRLTAIANRQADRTKLIGSKLDLGADSLVWQDQCWDSQVPLTAVVFVGPDANLQKQLRCLEEIATAKSSLSAVVLRKSWRGKVAGDNEDSDFDSLPPAEFARQVREMIPDTLIASYQDDEWLDRLSGSRFGSTLVLVNNAQIIDVVANPTPLDGARVLRIANR